MKTDPRLLLFILLMIFFSISCEKEIYEPVEVEVTNQSQMSLEPFGDALQQNLTIQYDEYHEAYLRRKTSPASRSADASDEQWIEYSAEFNGYITIEDSISSRNVFFTLLEQVLNDSSSVFTLLKFVPSMPLDESKTYTYFNLQDFSGTVYTYNQQAEMEFAIGVTDGSVQDFVIAENEGERNNNGARVQIAFPPPEPCEFYTNCNGSGGGGRWVWQPYRDYTDHYLITFANNTNYVQYEGSSYVIRTRHVWVPGNTSPGEGPHEHVSSGNGGHPTSSPHPNAFLKAKAELWETDNICTKTAFNQNSCINGAWSKLKDTNSAFKLLKNFNSENPTAEVCMDAKSIPNDSDGDRRGGRTFGNQNPIQVEINSDLVGQVSEIEFALYIFHELIHAEMWRKIQSVNNSLDPNNFPGLFDYYSRYFKVKKADGTYHYPNGTPQHNLMAQHYLRFITDALMEFDGVDPGNAMMRPEYEAIAWYGLKDTVVWDRLSSTEKQFIQQTWLGLNNRSKCN